MYPKFTARLLVRSIQVVRFWGTLPLRWKSGKLEKIQTKWRKFLWFLNGSAQQLSICFIIFRYVQLYFLSSVPAAMKTYLEYATLCYGYGILFQTTLCFHLDYVVDFINGYKGFFSKSPGELQRNLKVGRECDVMLGRYMGFGHLALSLNLLILFRRPERLVYFTSLFENPEGLGPLKIMPFAAVHVYIWWSMWSLIHLLDIHALACTHAQISAVSEYPLYTFYLKYRSTMEEARMDGRKVASLYRKSQVLQGKFNSGLGLLLAVGRLSAVLLIIRGVYSGMMATGGVRFLCCFTGLMAWAHVHATLKVFGQVHEVSSDALIVMKLKNRDPWFRRFRRSCPPLRVRMSKMVFCDRGLPMSLTAFIFDSIFGLLVAHST